MRTKHAIAAGALSVFVLAGVSQAAAIYTDGLNDVTTGQTYEPTQDIQSLAISNTTTDVTFTITVNGAIAATNRYFAFGVYTPAGPGPVCTEATQNILGSRAIHGISGPSDIGMNRRMFGQVGGAGSDTARYTGQNPTTSLPVYASLGTVPSTTVGNSATFTVPMSVFGAFDSGGAPIANSINIGDTLFISFATTTDLGGGNAADSLNDGQLTTGDYTTLNFIHSISYTLAPVPEPTTLGAIGLAGAGLLARRRRSN